MCQLLFCRIQKRPVDSNGVSAIVEPTLFMGQQNCNKVEKHEKNNKGSSAVPEQKAHGHDRSHHGVAEKVALNEKDSIS